MLALLLAPACDGDAEARAQAQKEVEALSARVASLEKAIQAAEKAAAEKTQVSGPSPDANARRLDALSGNVDAMAGDLDQLRTDVATMRKLLEERRAEMKMDDKKESKASWIEKEAKGEPEDEAIVIGVPECDDYVQYYAECIEKKLPSSVQETTRRALETSVDAWQKAAATPAGREGLAMACKTAYEAVKATCGTM